MMMDLTVLPPIQEVEQGASATFTIEVANLGAAELQGVAVVVIPPGGSEANGLCGEGVDSLAGVSTYTYDCTMTPPGEPGTYQYQVQADAITADNQRVFRTIYTQITVIEADAPTDAGDLTELVEQTEWVDVDFDWSSYDIVDESETDNTADAEFWFSGPNGTITSGSTLLVHDGTTATMDYTWSWVDQWGQEQVGTVSFEAVFSDTRDTIEYLRVYEKVTSPESMGDFQDFNYESEGEWTREWEIVVTAFIPLRSEDIITLVDGQHRVIEYFLEGDSSAHYTAWDRREVTDDGQVTMGYTLNNTKGGNRSIRALIRFYLPDV